jgi:hypothetical protein
MANYTMKLFGLMPDGKAITSFDFNKNGIEPTA